MSYCRLAFARMEQRLLKIGAKLTKNPTHVGINFNSKILITNPTTHYLGRCVFGVGILSIFTGVITHFTGNLLIPAGGWCILGLAPTFIGVVLMVDGVRKN